MSNLTIYRELEQGSQEWLQARCGVITASTIGQLITPSLKVADNEKSRALIMSLAAERISQYVEDTYTSFDMERGVLDEPKARDEYAERHNVIVDEVGFMARDFDGVTIGYSPDGLVGDNGLIEVKSRRQKTQLNTLMERQVPPANLAQLHCGLLVTGRDWIDYLSFAEGWPTYEQRITPDPAWMDALVAAAQNAEARIAQIVHDYRDLTAGMTPSERTPSYDDIRI